MEYTVSLEDGKITFIRTTEIDGEVIDKSVDIYFTVNEAGCFLPARDTFPFKPEGLLTIKKAMGLPEQCCCCNPEHKPSDILSSVYAAFASNIPVEEKQKTIVPAKEKIALPVKEKIDSRKKVDDLTIAMIMQSPFSDSKLAEITGLTRGYINALRKGKFRKSVL